MEQESDPIAETPIPPQATLPQHTALESLESRCSGVVLAIAGALLFQLLFLAYTPALKGPFQFDDIESIVGNPDLRQPFSLARFFGNHEISLHFDRRPIAGIASWIDFQLYELNAFGYRLTNLLLHFVAALAIFWGIKLVAERFRCTTPKLFALAVGSIWALHPLATSTVSFIYQRCELLMSLFYVVSLCCILQAHHTRHRTRWLVGAWIAALLSSLSKEVGLTLLVVSPLVERFCSFDSFKTLLRERKVYYSALLAAFASIVWWISTGVRMRELDHSGAFWTTPWGYLMFQFSAISRYIRLVFWPHPLVFFSVPNGWNLATKWMISLGFLASISVSIFLTGMRRRWLWLCGICFCGILAPTSSIIPIPLEPFAEFRMYLPMLFVLAVAVAAIALAMRKIASRTSTIPALALGMSFGVLIVTATLASRIRNRVYLSPITLWESVVVSEPLNGKALANLGVALLDSGQYDKAEICGRRLLSIGNLHGSEEFAKEGERILALVLLETGEADKALPTLQKLAEQRHSSMWSHIEFATALVRTGHLDQAGSLLSKLPPAYMSNPAIQTLMAELLIRKGQPEDARKILQQLERQSVTSRKIEQLLNLIKKSKPTK